MNKNTKIPIKKNSISGKFYMSLTKAFNTHQNNPKKAIAIVRRKLKVFGIKGTIKLINEILLDNNVLEQIANRSYVHGNGFYKIILEENQTYRLRLHIWFPTTYAEENIHDHRWHFASTILSGHLESETWEDAIPGGGEELDEYIYFGKTKIKDAYVQLIGKSKISLKKRTYYKKGDAYYLMSNEMHRIVYKGNTEVSTLMCHAKEARAWARTLTQRSILPDVAHDYITTVSLREVLQKYVSSLQGNQYN